MTEHSTARPHGEEEHATDAATLESRAKAQPTLLGDRANLRADEPDLEAARARRAALLDEVRSGRGDEPHDRAGGA